jgi:hypothetical protein
MTDSQAVIDALDQFAERLLHDGAPEPPWVTLLRFELAVKGDPIAALEARITWKAGRPRWSGTPVRWAS